MGELSRIAWTTSTFNPWAGCAKVTPGCANCYAERSMFPRLNGIKWGRYTERHIMSDDYWRRLASWNRKAALKPEPTFVFCGSLCDVLDEDAPPDQRERLWVAIRKTPALTWLLLTKREQNVDLLPRTLPANLWLGMTAENQEYLLRRGNVLSGVSATVKFLSVEPMLGPIDLFKLDNPKAIDWVIVGCESKAGRRPMNLHWARDVRHQCSELGIRFFMKQAEISGAVTDDIEQFPEDLRVREYPPALRASIVSGSVTNYEKNLPRSIQ